jgi:hypothetical protein
VVLNHAPVISYAEDALFKSLTAPAHIAYVGKVALAWQHIAPDFVRWRSLNREGKTWRLPDFIQV